VLADHGGGPGLFGGAEPVKKPRSDSRLKTLPEGEQAALAEYLTSHGLADTREWLAARGVKTSVAALSDFNGWYSLRRRLERRGTVVETLLEGLKERQPELSAEQVFEIGQGLFAALAIEEQDVGTWFKTQKLSLERRGLSQEERRIVLLEKRAAQAEQAQAVVGSDLSPEEQRNRLKEIFGLA